MAGQGGQLYLPVAEWIGRAEWSAAAEATRAKFMADAIKLIRERKRRQILAGMGADGRPLRPVQQLDDAGRVVRPRRQVGGKDARGRSLVHAMRKSRKDGATGPPLIPHLDASRALRLLVVVQARDEVLVTWSGNWARIMQYHREGVRYGHGYRRYTLVRNVVDFPAQDLADLRDSCRVLWARMRIAARATEAHRLAKRTVLQKVKDNLLGVFRRR